MRSTTAALTSTVNQSTNQGSDELHAVGAAFLRVNTYPCSCYLFIYLLFVMANEKHFIFQKFLENLVRSI